MKELSSSRLLRGSVRRKAPVLFTLVLAACSLNAVDRASAQTPASPSQTEHPSTNVLQQLKLKAEIAKLESENDTLRALDKNTRVYTTWLTAAGSITGAAIGSLITLLIWYLGRKNARLSQDKLEQDRENARELHNLRLFQDLGHDSDRARLAAAAVLLDRLHRLNLERDLPEGDEESRLIAGVLVAVLKQTASIEAGRAQGDSDSCLRKYIADKLVDTLNARFEPTTGPTSTVSPLRNFDFQNCCLVDVFWKDVDAREVDFFGSSLSKASLRGAALQGAVFYEADLTGAVLRYANLTGANLMNATLHKADLRNAILDGALLDGALLDGAMLDGARLEGSTLDGIQREHNKEKS